MIAVLTDGSEGGKQGDGKDCCKINDLDDWYAFDEAVLRSAKPQTSEYNGGGGILILIGGYLILDFCLLTYLPCEIFLHCSIYSSVL